MRASNQSAPKEHIRAIRCAIYTRKSTDEGLDRDFNTLDAQRESAEAFIKSQAAEGWVCLPDCYDDGGFSGGNMERPGVKRLLADVEAGKVDCIVVYKVDRLSRSLMDFSRLMGVLDQHGCSFVSVTQQFNTTHSMGRLTLNILLSFAQFEREIISERTRDKMSAARKKGKWMGGHPFLGYDVDPQRSKLIENPAEAEIVRAIFSIYREKRSLLESVREINAQGWERKQWLTRDNRLYGGGSWDKNNIYNLLTNIAYIGKVRYKGEIYEGEQSAILDEALWREVQTIMRYNGKNRDTERKPTDALLRGILCCEHCGTAMIHTYTAKKNRRYCYYVCMRAQKQGFDVCPNRSIPAAELEKFVLERIRAVGRDPGLLRATFAQVATINRDKLVAAESAARAVALEIKGIQTDIKGSFHDAGALVDLSDRLCRAEQKLALTTAKSEQIRAEKLDEADLETALAMFDPLWDSMAPAERGRVVGLLIERIGYDGKQGTLSITFHACGIRTLINNKENAQ